MQTGAAFQSTRLRCLLGVGVLATIVFEALAVAVFGRWAYNDAMPRLPVLGTGLVPLVQWLVIPGLVLWDRASPDRWKSIVPVTVRPGAALQDQ